MSKDEKSSDTKEAPAPRWLDYKMVLALGIVGLLAYQVVGSGLFFQEIETPFGKIKTGRETAQKIALESKYVVGRWQVEQQALGVTAGSTIDYYLDGRFEGRQTQFVGLQGQQAAVQGQWQFEKLADDEFRMTFRWPNGQAAANRFRVIDANRIQNMDQNYVAVRVPR